ncbi:anthranilate 1,2-dioxygenase large subunit [Polaromonas sp. OV174]|uniref:aromatic ring-hydroxylating dioxygenase subunit alpha n=1 Tax=Polaromonas sp. OV174 TaxID=1855300 RepID=UPI0008E3D8C2|nr:aromatic ring-hydroxylating dioxygenase subunit alpha [Polaromonas sp. OV174]SFB89929.1 anthranilate 1,2-dioxygenase large subunit [Polaromonas sp. OV174]
MEAPISIVPKTPNSAPLINRKWPEDGGTRIPAWVYSDSDIFNKEMDLFFSGRTWNYVGLACEVPEPGCFKRNWIGTKPVILVRGENDEFYVLENRCAHRGAQVCWKNTGQVKDFTCPYHQWNFALDGTLQGIPFKRGVLGKGGMPADFDPKKHGMRRLRSVNRGGSIWATFAEDAPSFEDYCGPEALAEIDLVMPGKPLKLLGYQRQVINSNWKTYLENLKDPYHATLLHSFYITFGLWRADSVSSNTPTVGGMHSVMTSTNSGKKVTEATAEMARFNDGLTMLDAETVTPRREFNNSRVGGVTLFPSAVLGIQANSLKTRHLIPISPTKHALVFTYYGYEDDDEEMSRLRLKHSNLIGPGGFVSMDDSEMLTQLQNGLSGYPESVGVIEMGGKGVEPVDYMVSEVLIRAFYKFYREMMGL